MELEKVLELKKAIDLLVKFCGSVDCEECPLARFECDPWELWEPRDAQDRLEKLLEKS